MFLLFVALGDGARCQEPVPKPAASAEADAVAAAQAVQRAFVEPDGDRRLAISAAASAVHRSGAPGRARFLTLLRAIVAAAPKNAPPADAGEGPAPIVFAAPVAATMNEVVTGTPEASAAALARLVEDRENGPAALDRLRQRGDLVLTRCVAAHVQEKLATNAIYAGQFAELTDYLPEAADLLLEWAARPSRHTPSSPSFRTACLRALRDVLPGDRATDTIRDELRGIMTKAQAAGQELLFVTAACALHQYGDPAPFEQLKAAVAENVANEQSPDRFSALNTLAELHYQLRQYAAAADYFAALLEASQKAGQPNERLTTLTYNLACSLALAGKNDAAFPTLDQALTLAAKGRLLPRAMIDEDHDLNGLRDDPRFAELLRRHFGATDR